MQEELAAQGAGLLLVVVSPAICGTIIGKYGTAEQKQQWLPSLADGSKIMAFGITEADAGSNSHQITTTARRDGDDWILSGNKIYISGVDQADAVLVVARTEDSKTGKLKPALFIVPTDFSRIREDADGDGHHRTGPPVHPLPRRRPSAGRPLWSAKPMPP